jgi:hypothetical protein
MTTDHRNFSYVEVDEQQFPHSLHICTYDVRGTILRTGQPKRCRQTGLVTHTHQLFLTSGGRSI